MNGICHPRIILPVSGPAAYGPGAPAAALLLAEQGAAERAVEVYACATRYGFVANSRWFEDLVGQPLRTMAASLPAEAVESAQEQGRLKDWGVIAGELLVGPTLKAE